MHEIEVVMLSKLSRRRNINIIISLSYVAKKKNKISLDADHKGEITKGRE